MSLPQDLEVSTKHGKVRRPGPLISDMGSSGRHPSSGALSGSRTYRVFCVCSWSARTAKCTSRMWAAPTAPPSMSKAHKWMHVEATAYSIRLAQQPQQLCRSGRFARKILFPPGVASNMPPLGPCVSSCVLCSTPLEAGRAYLISSGDLLRVGGTVLEVQLSLDEEAQGQAVGGTHEDKGDAMQVH